MCFSYIVESALPCICCNLL